tara:strand:+ start:1508 stop:2284 length:777 start_codon:yes stop_codon:yes gene_type:complete
MKTNMELMRQKLAKLRGQLNGNDKASPWFRPDEGTTDIRIVPSADGDPLKERFFHYNLGNHKGGVMCPKRNFGEECPICEFASMLWKEGVTNNDDESKNLAKSLFVRPRYFSPVIVRGKEDQGIKIYGYGKRAYELLLDIMLDPEYGDITEVHEGTDIALTYTKPTKPGAFPQTSLKMRRNTSPLVADTEAIPALLDRMPEFDSLFERLSTAQVNAILDEQLAGDTTAEERSTETTKYAANKKEKNVVDAAFNELMNG